MTYEHLSEQLYRISRMLLNENTEDATEQLVQLRDEVMKDGSIGPYNPITTKLSKEWLVSFRTPEGDAQETISFERPTSNQGAFCQFFHSHSPLHVIQACRPAA